jgi:hypothetical protein
MRFPNTEDMISEKMNQLLSSTTDGVTLRWSQEIFWALTSLHRGMGHGSELEGCYPDVR